MAAGDHIAVFKYVEEKTCRGDRANFFLVIKQKARETTCNIKIVYLQGKVFLC